MTIRLPNTQLDDTPSGRRKQHREIVDALRGLVATPAGGGSGTVTTTGTPASGNLTKFSGGTSITNGDLSGDVTTSGTLTATIPNDTVTYGKIQNVSATNRILGRITAGAGDIEELTAANVKTILGLAQADISGLTTADSPQFTALNLGHASDTTITRVSAGVIAVEGVNVITTTTGDARYTLIAHATSAITSSGHTMSTARLLGRTTASSGAIEEISVTSPITLSGGALSLSDLGVLHVQDQKASGTAGGTFTSGSWQTRVLTTAVTNTISSASLSSNQISLPAGTYDVWANAPAFRVGRHQLKLANITDASDILLGTIMDADTGTDGDQTLSFIAGRFTIAGTKTIELQHRCATTVATNGLGIECNWGTGILANVFIRRIA